MPRSPQLTMASFLKKPPDISPQHRKGKGSKRKLSSSPNSINAASAKKSNVTALPNVALPTLDSDFPPLPKALSPPIAKGIEKSSLSPPPLSYQLRPSLKKSPSNKKQIKAKTRNAIMNSSSLSSMDESLLEMDQEDAPILDSFPTSDEADALLRDDAPGKPPSTRSDGSAPSSPTAAVKSAIEAQIAENLNTLSTFNFDHVDSNKENVVVSAPAPTLTPFTAPPPLLKKPQPLFPEGLPINCTRNGPSPNSSISSAKPRGYFTDTGITKLGNVTGNKSILPPPKSTYASKAKSPPKARELVPNILYIYSTAVSKKPLSLFDWEGIDNFLIRKLAAQGSEGTRVRIAHSGYDAAHKCGFIACRDLASENWVKSAVRGGTCFRAWSKGEQPEVRLCRLFFPSRFDCLSDDLLVPLLVKHNPPLKQGILTPKNLELVQGGRALFLEMDAASYGYAKSKGHRLEFSMMDIDCQPYTPPVKRVLNLDTTPTQINPSPSGSNTAASAAAPIPAIEPSTKPPSLISHVTKPSDTGKISQVPNKDKKKRERPGPETLYRDASKKADTDNRPPPLISKI